MALLTERGLRFRKHGGVHAAFGEYFAKPGLLDAELHRWLLNAFDKRLESDYATESTLTREDAVQTIDQAREFVKRVANFLKSAR